MIALVSIGVTFNHTSASAVCLLISSPSPSPVKLVDRLRQTQPGKSVGITLQTKYNTATTGYGDHVCTTMTNLWSSQYSRDPEETLEKSGKSYHRLKWYTWTTLSCREDWQCLRGLCSTTQFLHMSWWICLTSVLAFSSHCSALCALFETM